jgi:hypothetical protein
LKLSGLILLLSARAALAGPSAESVVREALARPQSLDEEVQVTMRLLDGSGAEREPNRKFTILTRIRGESVKSLISVSLPPQVKGVRILSVRGEGENGQWIYLPAVKRAARVSSDEDQEGVLDSDLSYADVRDESIADNTYRFQPEPAADTATGKDQDPACGKDAVQFIEAAPKDPVKVYYAKRVLRISKARSLICGVRFLDAEGKTVKTLENEGYRKVEDRWRPAATVVKVFHGSGPASGETRLSYEGWRVPGKVSENLFSPSHLGD